MIRSSLTAVLLAAALIAGGQPAFPAERSPQPAAGPDQGALDRLVPPESGIDLEAWRAIFRGERRSGHVVARQLAESRNWPALRAVVEHGREEIALSWSLAYYVGYQPRWTAAQVARRVREWSGANPQPDGERVGAFSLKDLDQFMASRDKRLASELAAEMMTSPSPAVTRAGCRLAALSGDRGLARQLLGLLGERRGDLSSAAAEALAVLRRPAPLSGVTDRQLAVAIRAAAGAPGLAERIELDDGLASLAAALPEGERSGLLTPAVSAKAPSPGTPAVKDGPAAVGSDDVEAREQIRRGLRIFDDPAKMDLNWGACLTAATLGLEREACRTARMLLIYDYERPGSGDLAAWTAAKFKARELVPELAAGVLRSDAALGTRIWALGEIGDPAAVPTLAEVGLDPRWVVEVTSDPDAFRGAASQAAARPDKSRLLVDVTAEALEKITGHRVAARTPEELAAGWKKWCAGKRRKF